MVDLAIATGIPAREWREESDEAIATALQLLHDIVKAKEGRGG
jgi:hypothetical protein